MGTLAFTGFWMLLGSVGPLVLTGRSDPPGVVVGIGVLVAGVSLFFLSLRRLHQQMRAVKQRELDRARDLYMQAYQAVRDEPTLEVLQRQVGPLGAAEALEKRAERIRCGRSTKPPSPASWASLRALRPSLSATSY